MKARFTILSVVGIAFFSQAVDAPAPKVAAAGPNTPAEIEIPQSVFVIPASPKEGRNPFFPNSTLGVPVIRPKETSANFDFVLNGITPSGRRRTVMINNRTFEQGEEGDVKVASGEKVLIKCEEIKDDSAIISFGGGQRRELHLRGGL